MSVTFNIRHDTPMYQNLINDWIWDHQYEYCDYLISLPGVIRVWPLIHVTIIQFDSEENRTLFVLRWS